uniref:Uncharacterized protein n=1 Tax=Lygus hesperus TaxID=30085 RepID=A0A146KPR9_LYGHE
MSVAAECMVVLLLLSQSASQDQTSEQPALFKDCFKVLKQHHTSEIEPSTEPTRHVLEQKNVSDDYEFSYEMDDVDGSNPIIVEGIWTALTWYVWRDPTGNKYSIRCTTDATGSKVQLKLFEYTGGIVAGRDRLGVVISTGALKSLVEANGFRMPLPGRRIKFKKIVRKRQILADSPTAKHINEG